MINNLKDLEKLIKLLQKQGVEKFKFNDIEIQLDLSTQTKKDYYKPIDTPAYTPGGITEKTSIPEPIIGTDTLTEEQLLMWSVTSETN